MWKKNGRDKLIDRFHTCTNIQPSIYLKFFIFRFKKWKNPIPHDTSFSFDVAVFGQKIWPWYFWKVGLYVFLLVSKKMLVYVCTIWFNKVSWFFFFELLNYFVQAPCPMECYMHGSRLVILTNLKRGSTKISATKSLYVDVLSYPYSPRKYYCEIKSHGKGLV